MAPLAAASASLSVATDSHEMEEVQSEAQCADPATDTREANESGLVCRRLAGNATRP